MTQTIGRDEFRAAELAGKQAEREKATAFRRAEEAKRDDAARAFVAEHAPKCDGVTEEAEQRVAETLEFARQAAKFCVLADKFFTGLHRDQLADKPHYLDAVPVSQEMQDRFSNDHLARVFAAGFELAMMTEAGE